MDGWINRREGFFCFVFFRNEQINITQDLSILEDDLEISGGSVSNPFLNEIIPMGQST